LRPVKKSLNRDFGRLKGSLKIVISYLFRRNNLWVEYREWFLRAVGTRRKIQIKKPGIWKASNRIVTVQECDATMLNRITNAGNKKNE
jgi:hypothetical protein